MPAGVRRSLIVVATLALLGLAAAACAGASATESESSAPSESTDADGESEPPAFEGPTFVAPALGDVVSSPLEIEIDPGSVDPSGESIAADYHGRFHVLVDRGCVENGESIPIDEEGHHVAELFETTLTIDLPPGAHELCLQFANAYDVGFYSTDTVTVRVEG